MLASLLIVAVSLPALGPAPAAEPIDFGRDIRPLLFSRCVSCHGPDEAARKAGLRLDIEAGSRADLGDGVRAIVPGDPAASELLARVRAAHPDDRMPPARAGDPLTDGEVTLLERWIAGGADYAPHWAWLPPRAVEPPARPDGTRAAHPIDAFVEARARTAGLPLSPRADRATLVRRLSLDLTGLPPTPEAVDRFVSDPAPDAWERLVDRTLASPHLGERWASVWLDLARYADTKGYEADRGRTMWPWRDQLIRALDTDQPFDEFTLAMLAGDLLPDATEADRLATGFHRNTMTNDEGGTDDEEFRVAAVLDRVDTTMQVWMGLTAGCAQCHSHKYDPIDHREYYRLAAVFDQTADADRMDDAPTIQLLPEAERDAMLRDLVLPEVPAEPAPTPGESLELFTVVAGGRTPPGAALRVDGRDEPWTWSAPTAEGAPSVPVVRTRAADGAVSQVFFDRSYARRAVMAQDRWVAWVWLDPADPPSTVMLQVHADDGWEHRAVWGEDAIEFGLPGTSARHRVGDLPPAGTWARLSVPLAEIGVTPERRITGLAFTQRGGTVEWAGAWHESPLSPDERWTRSFDAFVSWLRDDPDAPLPAPLRAIVEDDAPSAEDRARLRAHFLTEVHPVGRERVAPWNARLADIDEEIAAIDARAPRVPVMEELARESRRTTHVLTLGNFLMPEEPVEPGVPAVWHAWPEGTPRNRLGFARWLVDPANPLTARVQVNRIWEQTFGTGLVETVEDFGTQGAPPSHPALLDHLAVRFVEDGWSLHSLLRRIVTSETYRRSSVSTPEQRARDPRDRLLSWSPRRRLPAEVLRDQALAIGGILSDRKFGPPVFPPQPPGVWQVIYNGATWEESTGEDRRRRSIYTYWRRTSPYPSALVFDAPSREVCSARRIATSTPLQALVLLNDPVHLEAAAGLGVILARAAAEAGPAAAVDTAFRRALARRAIAEERAILEDLFAEQRAVYATDPDAARALLARAWPDGPTEGIDTIDHAAWTVVAQVVLNHDAVLVRP